MRYRPLVRIAARGRGSIECIALDRPCDTCDGTGIDPLHRAVPDQEHLRRKCPDCDGTGRHTFTVEVEVGSDGKWTKKRPSTFTDDERAYLTYVTHGGPEPIRTYRVSVVPDTVLPIRKGPGIHPVPVIILYDDGVGMWQSGDDDPTVLDGFPPAAAPGMWAVKLAVAS